MKKPEVMIWGTGKPIREWLYVEDGAYALLKSLDLKSGHHSFNVGVKKGISIIDLANIIKDQVGWEGDFRDLRTGRLTPTVEALWVEAYVGDGVYGDGLLR